MVIDRLEEYSDWGLNSPQATLRWWLRDNNQDWVVGSKHRAIMTMLFMVKRNGMVNTSFETRDYEEWGRRGIPTGYLRLNGASVDPDFVLGEVNNGFKIAMEGFDMARTLIGAAAIGTAR